MKTPTSKLVKTLNKLNFSAKKQKNLNPNSILRLKNYLIKEYDSIMNLPKDDKRKALSMLNGLQYLEKSISRYNLLKKNNLKEEAKKEGEKIYNFSLGLSDDVVLKGGVSNCRYIWVASGDGCDECQSLDGEEFYSEDEIPDAPHPNCKCYVEIFYDEDSNSDDDEEECDCWEFFDNIDAILDEAQELTDTIVKTINDIETFISEHSDTISNYIRGMLNDLMSLEDPLNTTAQALGIFISNYQQMKDANTHGADKYFHAKANCEAAQLGIVGALIGEAISELREYSDQYRNINDKKLSIEESIKDCEEDQEANREGRATGWTCPIDDCGDLLKHLKPNGLPERY